MKITRDTDIIQATFSLITDKRTRRVAMTLKSIGIDTVGKALDYKANEILTVHNCGRRAVDEIEYIQREFLQNVEEDDRADEWQQFRKNLAKDLLIAIVKSGKITDPREIMNTTMELTYALIARLS